MLYPGINWYFYFSSQLWRQNRASGRSISLSNLYLIAMSYGCKWNNINCNLSGAEAGFFILIISRSLWSLFTVTTCHRGMYETSCNGKPLPVAIYLCVNSRYLSVRDLDVKTMGCPLVGGMHWGIYWMQLPVQRWSWNGYIIGEASGKLWPKGNGATGRID